LWYYLPCTDRFAHLVASAVVSGGGPREDGCLLQPVYHVLSEAVAVCVAHSHDVRQRPGQKTDESDATWMAELLAHGLMQPRCVPPPAMRA
jgi:transposase